MNNNLLRSILAGLLLGVALFVMPFFLIRLVFFFVIIGVLFRLFGGGGWGRGQRSGYMPAFADRIRQMSDEEYTTFKQRYDQGHCKSGAAQKSTETTDTTKQQN